MSYRIQRRDTFERLRRPDGSARRGPLRVSRVASRNGEPELAFGFAVPRRYGNAVQRNRVRRQMRHILSGLGRRGDLPHGQYLIAINSSAPIADFDTLDQSLRAAVRSLEPAGTPGSGAAAGVSGDSGA